MIHSSTSIMKPQDYAALYKNNLLNSVIPFWMEHSRDDASGGYFTCLDTTGNVYDTDKFMWLQCRQIWCFAMLYNRVGKKQEWLDFALHGANFVLEHGRDAGGNFYFSLDRAGNPLVQPYNIFSDCFATMAFGQLYLATKNELYADVARNTFYNILDRAENTKGIYNKSYPGTRPLLSFSLPMILCNLVTEIETLLPADLYQQTIAHGIDTVMNRFYQPDLGLIVEHIQPDGTRSNSFEGRLINPGHGIEAMWFIMDLAEKQQDKTLIQKAVDITIATLEYAWDEKHEGIFYFLDQKGSPPQQLEWDQKLWWVHIESMISLAKGYAHTNDQRCWQWFEKLHAYTWKHFVDEENGEWFGYLNRKGEILLPLKGGKWKGCFHVPRGLYQLWQTMEKINAK
ncbi:AGE family epimerase/isomerase [Terrimonas sp. NA20]|uniref:AGE family epimerase/isomerase n=1 Tax=Terrimonas ginsenosidimutans TaxID=2908004 RepID=A0ABS9KS83_9BACT|nr:AGE family epimerase/isomerase [Terrimonas ginsenosidimutans]MCG2615163.1 AGE family epimerase/isomerase [Terrimonas ginsenosidimutans]